MDILEKARELGETLANSEEYKRMQAAEKAKNESEEAVKLLNNYNKMASDFAMKIQAAEPTKEEMENYRESLSKAFAEIDANPTVHEFIEAKKCFDELMKNINSIIAFYVVPKGQASCSGDCGSCGGCH